MPKIRKKTLKQRLGLSNSAHKRLMKKNKQKYKTSKYDEKYQQRALYHGLVLNLQEKQQKVFNESEKKNAWNKMISDMY